MTVILSCTTISHKVRCKAILFQYSLSKTLCLKAEVCLSKVLACMRKNDLQVIESASFLKNFSRHCFLLVFRLKSLVREEGTWLQPPHAEEAASLGKGSTSSEDGPELLCLVIGGPLGAGSPCLYPPSWSLPAVSAQGAPSSDMHKGRLRCSPGVCWVLPDLPERDSGPRPGRPVPAAPGSAV